jgi:quercetin dioxygenase-like cupin family protein
MSGTEPLRNALEVKMQKVTPADVAEGLTEFWSQQVIGSANGNLFKVAKGIGSTTWHTHEDQEETFLILRGQLTIQLRSGDVHLNPGDLFVIPRGVEHCPHAEEEAHFLLVGPEVTSNAAGGKPAWSYGQSGEAQPASG